MPTFTGRRVNVASYTLHTTLSLEQIADALAADAPTGARTPGWGTSYSADTVLDRDGFIGAGVPSVQPEMGDVPRRVAGRYFYWRFDPLDADSGESAARNWVLDAVDVLISESGEQSHLVLLSTTDNELADAREGTVPSAILEAVQTLHADAESSVASPLAFPSGDVFLWLAQQSETGAPLGGATKVHAIAKVDAEEDRRRYRTATLRGNVDMQRVTFLNAIAEGSALGPAVVTMSQPNTDGKLEFVVARVWRDGRFGLLMTDTKLRDIVDGELQRLEAVYRFAYRYLPVINEAYAEDDSWAERERDWLVISKRLELAEHYRALAEQHPRWGEYQVGVTP